jgi:hypothetical protein
LSASFVFPVSGVTAGGEGKEADRVVGLTYKEPKETEFLKAVLKSLNLHYTMTPTPDGELVEWPSTDPAQELEIQNRVSQFWFISTQCPGILPPAPLQPARARLSC